MPLTNRRKLLVLRSPGDGLGRFRLARTLFPQTARDADIGGLPGSMQSFSGEAIGAGIACTRAFLWTGSRAARFTDRALNTKGEEALFLNQHLSAGAIKVLVIDVAVLWLRIYSGGHRVSHLRPSCSPLGQAHKEMIRSYLRGARRRSRRADPVILAEQLYLLFERARTSSQLHGEPWPAEHAGKAAEKLFTAPSTESRPSKKGRRRVP